MNKILLMGVALIAGVVAWSFFTDATSPSPVVSFTDEVAALETELASIEAEVAAGSLTPQAASAAHTRIETRLTVLTDASAAIQAEAVTPAQRAQLMAGLEKLTQLLITYQDTLQTVDEQVATLPATERPVADTGNGSIRLQVVAAIETIDAQFAVELAETATVATESEITTDTAATDKEMTVAQETEDVVYQAADAEVSTEIPMNDELRVDEEIETESTANETSGVELETDTTTATTS